MSKKPTKRGPSPARSTVSDTDVEFVSDHEMANRSYTMYGYDSDGGYESNASNISAITNIPDSKEKQEEERM